MYASIDDLPFVCQFNLPEAALKVYREAYNRAWADAGDGAARHGQAQGHAWIAVRDRFEREKETGRWIPRTAPLEPRVVRAMSSTAAVAKTVTGEPSIR
jgi:cation transport regulator ChaB